MQGDSNLAVYDNNNAGKWDLNSLNNDLKIIADDIRGTIIWLRHGDASGADLVPLASIKDRKYLT